MATWAGPFRDVAKTRMRPCDHYEQPGAVARTLRPRASQGLIQHYQGFRGPASRPHAALSQCPVQVHEKIGFGDMLEARGSPPVRPASPITGAVERIRGSALPASRAVLS